jgi:hypothetical protein
MRKARMSDQYLSGDFPTLERLALGDFRSCRKGFSAAVRAAFMREEPYWDPPSIGFVPDGWFEEPAGYFTCVEVEDGTAAAATSACCTRAHTRTGGPQPFSAELNYSKLQRATMMFGSEPGAQASIKKRREK